MALNMLVILKIFKWFGHLGLGPAPPDLTVRSQGITRNVP